MSAVDWEDHLFAHQLEASESLAASLGRQEEARAWQVVWLEGEGGGGGAGSVASMSWGGGGQPLSLVEGDGMSCR